MTHLPEDRYEAVLERRYLPGVILAVTTTKIYCRTDCPARRPARENIRFLTSPAEAESAGFRACKRCRPQDAEQEERDLRRVLELLQDAPEKLSLNALAQRSGLDPSTITRLFRRDLGVTPSIYQVALRAERLKHHLKEGQSVTAALYEAGYGSSRALYEHASHLLGMTPKTYQRGGQGTRVVAATFDTPLGRALIAATERGVCALRFDDDLSDLRREFPNAAFAEGAAQLAPYIRAVQAYLSGEGRLELPLDVSPTAFQAKVWTALQKIPYGETRSYAQVAEMIGDKKAVRAVASACASNPVALAVPCHRVVRADGSLSGYRWGAERKRRLLEREQAARQEARLAFSEG